MAPFSVCIAAFRVIAEFGSMAVRSKQTIFDAALLTTGNATSVLGSGSFILQALEANYDEIVRAAFEEQEYPFGKNRTTLTGRSVGRFGYDDAYQMPSDVIHVTDVFLDTYTVDHGIRKWEIDASTNELLIDAESRVVEIEYLKSGMEHTWSSKFTRGIQKRLEAVIKTVEEEDGEAMSRENEADSIFLKAGIKASKNRSKRRVFRGGRLVRAHSVRYGGRDDRGS